MKKAVGILGTLAILWGCFSNVAFAADVNMISDKSVAGLEKVEITSETRVRLAGNEMLFLTKDSESVNLTDLDSRVLDDTQLIVNDVLKGARATGSITWDTIYENERFRQFFAEGSIQDTKTSGTQNFSVNSPLWEG